MKGLSVTVAAVSLFFLVSVGSVQAQGNLRLVALAGNAAVSLETTSTSFQDIPDTAVTFKTDKGSCVLAQFSVLSRGDVGNVFVHALLDGQEMQPGETRFGPHIPTPGAFTYFEGNVSRGDHELILQFRSATEDTTAVISERSLVVMEAKGFKGPINLP